MRDPEFYKFNEDKRWTFETNSPKEILFKNFVEEQILNDYKKDLLSLGISEDVVDSIDDLFLGDFFSDRDKEIFCTLPYEIRLRQFNSYFEEKNKTVDEFNEKDWVDFISYIIELNKDLDPHIGFHATPSVVSKEKLQNQTNREKWSIKGTEQDHRNDDMPMAYYSLSLEKLFRQKNINKLYIVRANLAPGNNHYPDNDGHWGRSGNLSIISEINFTDEDNKRLDELVKNYIIDSEIDSEKENAA
jgi:hypothetical protein